MMEKIKICGCEIELGNRKRKIFVKIYFDQLEIWIDLKGLPTTALLCALCDGTPFIEGKVGAKGKEIRTFVNVEWAINDWGGDQEIVDDIKKIKQMILDDLPRLKEKYGDCTASSAA
jgi:hypothetical protein